MTEVTTKTLMEIKNLKLYFRASRGIVQAVDDVDLAMYPNEAVVVIGESGCGKSSMAKALLRLLPRNVAHYSGEVNFNGVNIMALDEEKFRQDVRWVRISMVPQAAMNSLNPVLRVGDQVAEPMMVHHRVSREAALNNARTLFKRVGVPVDFLSRYAFELSGGMRQRVAIAMSLITVPDLVILDEPTSALDVLTQANIMNLLKQIKKEIATSFLLITHDIATSSELADRVAVMYAGQIVEVGKNYEFFTQPLHPYSAALMASVPRLRSNAELNFIGGQPPSLINPPTGCRFAARCPRKFERCSEEPPMVTTSDGRQVKCWLYV